MLHSRGSASAVWLYSIAIGSHHRREPAARESHFATLDGLIGKRLQRATSRESEGVSSRASERASIVPVGVDRSESASRIGVSDPARVTEPRTNTRDSFPGTVIRICEVQRKQEPANGFSQCLRRTRTSKGGRAPSAVGSSWYVITCLRKASIKEY